MTETAIPIAFLDASVLYPALLRNILMRLAIHGRFRAHWSARVHEEWITALLRNRKDLVRSQLERTRALMDSHVRDACVEGYEDRIDSLSLPDADDRHVLAAAIHCGANHIVTANLRDFPSAALAPFGVEACHPDAFILGLLENDRDAVLATICRLRKAYKNPPLTASNLVATMKKHGLAASAEALVPFVDSF